MLVKRRIKLKPGPQLVFMQKLFKFTREEYIEKFLKKGIPHVLDLPGGVESQAIYPIKFIPADDENNPFVDVPVCDCYAHYLDQKAKYADRDKDWEISQEIYIVSDWIETLHDCDCEMCKVLT